MEKFALQGKSKIYGSTAAVVVENINRMRQKSTINSFSNQFNIENRQEHISNIQGVEYINDSKATNENATWWTFENISRPIIWITSGENEKTNYNKLTNCVRNKVKAIICLRNNNKMYNAYADEVEHIFEAKDLKQAVEIAGIVSEKGDVVLLSPTCKSFDLFDDYKDMAKQFIDAVKNL